MKRISSILLAATLGSARAQSIHGSADAIARSDSALPADGGHLVAEANATAHADASAWNDDEADDDHGPVGIVVGLGS